MRVIGGRKLLFGVGLAVCIGLLSLIAVFNQVKAQGLQWQEDHYWPHLVSARMGMAGAPAQYRFLSIQIVARLAEAARDAGVPRPIGVTFVALRLAQTFALFTVALLYYRRLGIHPYLGIFGVSALAWGMTMGNEGCYLALDAHMDVLFYMMAGWCIVAGRPAWLLLLCPLAALNRETSIFIPFMLLAASLRFRSDGPPRLPHNRALIVAGALGLHAVVFLGLRLHYGFQDFTGLPPGMQPGFPMILHNFGHSNTWLHLAGVLGVMPILALFTGRRIPPVLRSFFWAVVPIWVLLNLMGGVMARGHVMLMPQALVFVPAVLCGIAAVRESNAQSDERAPA